MKFQASVYIAKQETYGVAVSPTLIDMDVNDFANAVNAGLNPLSVSINTIRSGYYYNSSILSKNPGTGYNSNVSVADIIIVKDVEDLFPYLEPNIVATEMGVSTSVNNVPYGTQQRCDEIKRILALGNIDPNDWRTIRNDCGLRDQKKSGLLPRYILTDEEFLNRYVPAPNGMIFEKSNRWNLVFGTDILLMRNEDEFMILPQGVIVDKETFLDMLTSLGLDKDITNYGTKKQGSRLPDSNMTFSCRPLIPGVLKNLPELEINKDYLDHLMEKHHIPGTSSMRKHEQFLAIAENYNMYPQSHPEMPEFWQLITEDMGGIGVETIDKEQYLMALFKTVFQPDSDIGVGSSSMPIVPERVSPDGKYKPGAISFIPEWNGGINNMAWFNTQVAFGQSRSSEL